MTAETAYAVWIVVENEETGDKTYWSVDHHHDEDAAFEHAEAMADAEYRRTGLRPDRLED